MISFRSILSRIVSLHIVALALASILLPLALYLLLKSEATELQKQALSENADAIAQYLARETDGTWKLNLPGPLQNLYSDAYGRYGYAVFDANARALFTSSPGKLTALPEPSTRAEGPAFFELDRGVSGATIPKVIGGERVWVQVLQDLTHRDVLIDDVVRNFFYSVGWITIPAFFILLLIDVAIFRRALRPLIEASDLAQSISPARTDIRLPTRRMPSEVLPLVEKVNEAFDRLERGFQMQRDFTADAAHELRTPLAILHARVETAAISGVTSALLRDIDGMTRIVNQLLDVAKLENFSVDPGETADLKTVCQEVAEALAPLALKDGKEIVLESPNTPVLITGNATALFQAVRNVAENALRHTPRGTYVTIHVTSGGDVTVTDEGSGIAPEDRDLIFRRFWRKHRYSSGAGLGLSIVKQIADAHGANIVIGAGDAGGAKVTLCFGTVPGPEAAPPAERQPKGNMPASFLLTTKAVTPR